MTSTPNTSSEFPTEWHVINVITGMYSRQLSEDTYQLRSSSHTITINKEGFNSYREGPPAKFDQWLDIHNIDSEPWTGNG